MRTNEGQAVKCDHPSLPMPAFDLEDARKLTVSEIRAKYPRGWAACPDCHKTVISYASKAHYVFGDW